MTVWQQSLVLGPRLFIPLKIQLDWAQDPQQGQETALNRVLQREHMAPSRFANESPCGTRDAQTPVLVYYISRDHPNAHELTNHIRHRRGGASIAAIRPAVTGCVREDVAQVVWNGPDVADGYNWQFSVSNEQTVVHCKMALAPSGFTSPDSINSNLSSTALTWEIIAIITIIVIIKKESLLSFASKWLLLP